MSGERRGPGPTCQDSAGDPRDALDLRHVVVHEVLVAGGVEQRRVAEHSPQLSGDGAVGRLDGLGAHVKRLPHQRAVAQDAHAAEEGKQVHFFPFHYSTGSRGKFSAQEKDREAEANASGGPHA